VVGGTGKPRFVLDTGIIIRELNQEERASQLLNHLRNIGVVEVSSITVMEVFAGCRDEDEEAKAAQLFDLVRPIALGEEAAAIAGRLVRKYPSVFGRAIQRGSPDALIAATAISANARLVTLDRKDFKQVKEPNLAITILQQSAQSWVPLRF
jgi:predicted nucleic acid-binding protein